MRILLGVVLVLAAVLLCAGLLVLSAVGLGYGLARLVPLSLFQTSILSFFSLIAVATVAARAFFALAELGGSPIADHLTADSGPVFVEDHDNDDEPVARSVILAVAEEVINSPRRPRRRQRAPKRPHRPERKDE